MQVKDVDSSYDKLLKVTADLIQLQGYNGTSLSKILSDSNLPKGSLYHHFPKGKDQLVCEAIKYAGKIELMAFSEAMRGKKAPELGIAAVVDLLIYRLEKSDFKRGCPISTAMLETASTKEDIRTTCWEVYLNWEARFSAYLDMKGIEEADEKGKLLLDMIEGAFILSRAHRNTEHLKIVRKAIKRIL